ncbi:cyclic nucleotide-binding domain-containing protein [Altererythrobacter sp.]|uniref:cyclic nucleotide-binding domain-containing protein n=1 Tax=Altererythrobacter sp. TaxID=1872480 RepID=UPI003D10842A
MAVIVSDTSGSVGILAHVAAILLIASMLMTTMRWLRIAALGSGLAAVACFAVAGAGTSALVLALLFVITNAAQLAILLYRSRMHRMNQEERELLEHVLEVQEPAQQRRLLDLLEWRDVDEGEVLMEQGQPKPPLIYVASGAAAIEHGGQIVGICGPGDFLGEMALITGEPASATVRVTNSVRIARFDRDALGQLTHSLPEMKRAFDAALNRGLAAKVLRMNQAAAGQDV